MNPLTVADAVAHYKVLHTTWANKYNDPQYGPEIFMEVFGDLDRELVDTAIRKALTTEWEYGAPDMSKLRGVAMKIYRDRQRSVEAQLPMCSLCARPETHSIHDVRRGITAHAYEPPKPRRMNTKKAPQTIARPWRAGLPAPEPVARESAAHAYVREIVEEGRAAREAEF